MIQIIFKNMPFTEKREEKLDLCKFLVNLCKIKTKMKNLFRIEFFYFSQMRYKIFRNHHHHPLPFPWPTQLPAARVRFFPQHSPNPCRRTLADNAWP